MANRTDLMAFVFMLFIASGAAVAVMSVQTPGTSTPGIGGDQEPRYVLNAEVGVGSAELKQDKIKIKEQSFRYDVKKQGLFNSLSFTGGSGALSLLKAENVEMKYRLTGPVTRSSTDQLGNVGAISASKLSTFKAGNLPCGTYDLEMKLRWNTGQDQFNKQIEIACRGESQ